MFDELIHSVIQRIAVGPDRGRDISRVEAEQVMRAILAGQVDDVQTAVILIALRMKRESLDEFGGMFAALHDELAVVVAPVDELYCLADPFDGYLRCLPMTPFLPPVLAACGLPACLSGVDSVAPKFGVTAQQVYSLANIATGFSAQKAATALASCGWAYVAQDVYAPRLFAMRKLRQRIVKRTAVTTLERLLNPLRGGQHTHLILGFVHKAYPEIYTAIARQAGFSSALLCKGVEGGLAPATNKPLRQHLTRFDTAHAKTRLIKTELPESIVGATSAHALRGAEYATAQATLDLGIEVLNGATGPARNSLLLAAAQVVMVYKKQLSIERAVEKVQNCLDNGSALGRFTAMLEFSKGP